MITKKRLKNIKENVYMRSEIAKISGIGIDTSLREELELIEEIERLNNIINELESYLEQQWLEWKDDYNDEIVAMANEDKAILHKLKELKENNK